MRSTAAIIAAVQDGEEVTMDELKCALVAMSCIEQSVNRKYEGMAEACTVRLDTLISIRLRQYKEHAQWRFNALKMDPQQYLGPDLTPGTPEQREMHKIHMGVLNAAMKRVEEKKKQEE